MVAKPEDIYGVYGSVPDVRAEGGGGTPMGVRANPEDFGGQVGEATSKLGTMGLDAATKYMQMSQEAHAEDIIANQFVPAANQLRTNFYSLKGKAAVEGQGAYIQSMNNLRTQFLARDDVSPYTKQIVGHYMMQHAAQETDFSSRYVVQQNDDYIKQSHEAYIGANAQSAMNNYTDPDARNAALQKMDGSIEKYGHDMGQPPEYIEEQKREMRGKAVTEMVRRAANAGDFNAAQNIYNENKSTISADAIGKIDGFLAPKLDNTHMSGVVDNIVQGARQQYSNLTASPLAVRNNNPGNLRDPATGQFRIFDTPEAGAAAMQADLTAKISGNSAAMERNFGKGYSPTLSNVITTYAPPNENNTIAYINSVSKETGFAPDKPLTVADIPKLQAAMTKIESGGSGQQVAHMPQKINEGDYLRQNEQDLVDQAVNNYAKQYGADYFKLQEVRQRAQTAIDHIIHMDDNKINAASSAVMNTVQNGVNGRLPTTTQEISLFNPQAADALDLLQSDPKKMKAVNKALAANVNLEKKKGYGDGFLPILDRITSDDPTDSIHDAKGLLDAYGERDDLHINGYAQAQKLLQQAQTPQGKSQLAQEAQFLNDIYQRMVAGDNDTAGKAAFNKKLPEFFAQYETLAKDGKQAQMLTPDSDFVKSLNLPTPQQMTTRKIKNSQGFIDQMVAALGQYSVL